MYIHHLYSVTKGEGCCGIKTQIISLVGLQEKEKTQSTVTTYSGRRNCLMWTDRRQSLDPLANGRIFRHSFTKHL